MFQCEWRFLHSLVSFRILTGTEFCTADLRVISVPIASLMFMAQTLIAYFGAVSTNYLTEITFSFKLYVELKLSL